MQRLFEASLTDAARRTFTIATSREPLKRAFVVASTVFPHAGVGCLTARTSLRSS
jgi:hypothetical protein